MAIASAALPLRRLLGGFVAALFFWCGTAASDLVGYNTCAAVPLTTIHWRGSAANYMASARHCR